MLWANSSAPGFPLSYAGVRKGGMISLPLSALRITLDEESIKLPKELFDVVQLATQPVAAHDADEHGGLENVVNCADMGRFPELVFAVGVEDEEGEEKDVELVVGVEQYVRRVSDGGDDDKEEKCVLLVREGEEDEVVLGWAGLRGRRMDIDWRDGLVGVQI